VPLTPEALESVQLFSHHYWGSGLGEGTQESVIAKRTQDTDMIRRVRISENETTLGACAPSAARISLPQDAAPFE